jgi:hypothetical protein
MYSLNSSGEIFGLQLHLCKRKYMHVFIRACTYVDQWHCVRVFCKWLFEKDVVRILDPIQGNIRHVRRDQPVSGQIYMLLIFTLRLVLHYFSLLFNFLPSLFLIHNHTYFPCFSSKFSFLQLSLTRVIFIFLRTLLITHSS